MEEKIKSDIVRATSSVKKKFKLIKRGLLEEEARRRKHFEPLLKPIETLIDLTDDHNKGLENLKESVKISDDDLNEKFKFIDENVDQKIRKLDKKINLQHRAKKSSEDKGTLTSVLEEIYEDPAEAQDVWHSWNELIKRYGPITKKYLTDMSTDQNLRFDHKFGVRGSDTEGVWFIGNKIIDFDKSDDVHIDNNVFYGSKGLFELLFKKIPDKKVYNEVDLENYKKILELSSAHLQGYNPAARLASSSGIKYNNIISHLFIPQKKKKGGVLLPVTDNKIDYQYWDDPNELVERLVLLKSSQSAGNNSHLAEITSIEEELREAGFIE